MATVVMVVVVVVVRTVSEARSQSQCHVLRNGGPGGGLICLGECPLNVSLQSVLMGLKLNFSDCSHTT